MARLFLEEGQTFGTISVGTTDVIGTNGNEIVYVAETGRAVFDPSFNRGGDEIVFLAEAATFDGALSGSNFVVTSNFGAIVSIPIGTAGTTITFDDGTETNSYTLQFDGANVTLGAQIITNSPEALDDLDSMPPLSASFGEDAPPAPEVPLGSDFLTLG